MPNDTTEIDSEEEIQKFLETSKEILKSTDCELDILTYQPKKSRYYKNIQLISDLDFNTS